MDRGQTTFDFAVGMTLFLLVVGFVFTVAPGMFEPHEQGESRNALVADGAATRLVTTVLTEPDRRYFLDAGAVDDYFNHTGVAAAADRVGVPDDYALYVTLNASDRSVSLGSPPPADASVTVAWRVVEWSGDRTDLRVRVWSG
jgi:hypothetical protein